MFSVTKADVNNVRFRSSAPLEIAKVAQGFIPKILIDA
jgi:hypothetical protein